MLLVDRMKLETCELLLFLLRVNKKYEIAYIPLEVCLLVSWHSKVYAYYSAQNNSRSTDSHGPKMLVVRSIFIPCWSFWPATFIFIRLAHLSTQHLTSICIWPKLPYGDFFKNINANDSTRENLGVRNIWFGRGFHRVDFWSLWIFDGQKPVILTEDMLTIIFNSACVNYS